MLRVTEANMLAQVTCGETQVRTPATTCPRVLFHFVVMKIAATHKIITSPSQFSFSKKINLELGNTANFCGEQLLLIFPSFDVLLLFIYCLRFPWEQKAT